MELVTVILDFVKNLLGFLNEGEAAGIVGIVKDFIGGLSGEGLTEILEGVKNLLGSLGEGEAAGIVGIVKDFIANIPALL